MQGKEKRRVSQSGSTTGTIEGDGEVSKIFYIDIFNFPTFDPYIN